MNNLFVDQPVLSSSEVAVFLKKAGLDFSAWPQSTLPFELTEAMLAAAGNPADDTSEAARQETNNLRAGIPQEGNSTHAIIRTPWGCLIGERHEPDPEDGLDSGGYSVEVLCAKVWGSEAIGAYSDACIELLYESLNAFRKKNRGGCPDVDEAAGEAVVDIFFLFDPKDGEKAEEKSRDDMLKYLVQIFEKGTIDKVIEVACSNEME